MSPASCYGAMLVLLGRQLREGRSTGELKSCRYLLWGLESPLFISGRKGQWKEQSFGVGGLGFVSLLCLVLAVWPWTSYMTSLSLIIKTWQSSLSRWVIGEFNEIITSSCEPDILRGLINVRVLCIKKRWKFLPCLCDRLGGLNFWAFALCQSLFYKCFIHINSFTPHNSSMTQTRLLFLVMKEVSQVNKS